MRGWVLGGLAAATATRAPARPHRARACSVHRFDLSEARHKEDWYLRICPNGRIPAIGGRALGCGVRLRTCAGVLQPPHSCPPPPAPPTHTHPVDHDRGDLAVWESGALLLHLGETRDPEQRLLPTDPARRAEVLSWLFWQVVSFRSRHGRAGGVWVVGWGTGQWEGVCGWVGQQAAPRAPAVHASPATPPPAPRVAWAPCRGRPIGGCSLRPSAMRPPSLATSMRRSGCSGAGVRVKASPCLVCPTPPPPACPPRAPLPPPCPPRVMERQLEGREWLAGGQYSLADIATFSWVLFHDLAAIPLTQVKVTKRASMRAPSHTQ